MKTRRQYVSDDALTITRRCNKRSKTQISERENSLPIPVDLIIEIFSRLPAKSIARFRCLSKLWTSILVLPYFTELFLKKSLARPKVLLAYQKNKQLFFSSLPQLQNPDVNSSPLCANRLTHFSFEGDREISPVHGLVCLIDRRYSKGRTKTVLVICNPSTGQSLPLPKVKTRRGMVRSFFGYDPIEKLFKVLAMTLTCKGRRNMYEEHQVLTLGAAGKLSWRMIDCSIPHNPVSGITGICINGGLYYHAHTSGVVSSTIACFDVRFEKFRIIKKDKGMVTWRFSTLVNYKGKLGAVEVSDNGTFCSITGQTRCLDLWVLVDAENHQWLKHIYVLPPSWKSVVATATLYVVGVVTETKEIVLSPQYTRGPFFIFYYNLEEKTVRRVEVRGIDEVEHSRVSIFLDHVEDVRLMQMLTS